MEFISRSSDTSGHVCLKWPSNLLSSVCIKIVRSFRRYCLVDRFGDTDHKGVNERAIFSSALFNPSPGTEIQAYGVWILKDRFLHLGIFSSWKDKNGVIPGLHSRARLDASSISENFLHLTSMDGLLVRCFDHISAELNNTIVQLTEELTFLT